jgi:type I restriction enzyme S subunit
MSFPRYGSYKDSGIDRLGEIPSHWNVCSVKQVCDTITDGAHVSPETEDGAFCFVSTKDLIRQGIDFDGCLRTSKASYEYLVRTGCRPHVGDVLFSKDGTIGRTVVVNEERDFVVASSLIIIRPDKKRLNANYLHLLCQSNFVCSQVESLVRGAGLPRLSIQNLLRVVGLFPPIAEQFAIAAFLDRETAKIDALVEEQQRLIELLKEKRQAVISHAVTKGLNPNAPMKESGEECLGVVPQHWSITNLGAICTKIGSGKTPLGGAEAYSLSGVLFLRSQNVYDEGLRLDDVVYIDNLLDEEMVGTRVFPGDVLLNITGASLGRTELVPDRFPAANVNQHVCIIRLRELAHRHFVSLFLKSPGAKVQFELGQSGAAREGLNFQTVSKLILPLPPKEEQALIVGYLQRNLLQINTLIFETNKAINLLQERRAALISAAVTGKIDVGGLVAADVRTPKGVAA